MKRDAGVEWIKWPEEVTNEEVLEHIEEKWTFLRRNFLRRNANSIGNILRGNFL